MAEAEDDVPPPEDMGPVDSKKLYRALEVVQAELETKEAVNIRASVSSLLRPIIDHGGAKSKVNSHTSSVQKMSNPKKKDSILKTVINEEPEDNEEVKKFNKREQILARNVRKVTLKTERLKRITNTPFLRGIMPMDPSRKSTCPNCKKDAPKSSKGFYAWSYQPILNYHPESYPPKTRAPPPQRYSQGPPPRLLMYQPGPIQYPTVHHPHPLPVPPMYRPGPSQMSSKNRGPPSTSSTKRLSGPSGTNPTIYKGSVRKSLRSRKQKVVAARPLSMKGGPSSVKKIASSFKNRPSSVKKRPSSSKKKPSSSKKKPKTPKKKKSSSKK